MSFIKKAYHYFRLMVKTSPGKLDRILVGQAKLLASYNKGREELIKKDIKIAEFSVFSQWGDDGIIEFLVDYLGIEQKIFVEFGIGDYTESNTRYLMMNRNWSGLIMDGSEKYINSIKSQDVYWKYDLTAVQTFVSKENINSLLKDNGINGEIGLLHIDIDGNDYWIWEEINGIQPIIVIMEYNSFFGDIHPFTIPYKSDFTKELSSGHIYWGASITSLCDLAKEKGYSFIGCNSNGNNAYFIRNDKIKDIKVKEVSEGYVLGKFREGRNSDGKLNYKNTKIADLEGLSVYNTRTKNTEIFSLK